MKRTARSAALIGLLAAVGGCVHKELIALDEYQPIVRGVEEPNVAVALRMEDARASRAEDDPAYVGVLRGSFGETTEFRLSDAAAVHYLVRVATKDALRLARVAVSPRAPRTLVVTIRKFWVAVPSREAHVVVDLLLRDHAGETLWTGEAGGGAGGLVWADFPQSSMRRIYQRSLADYAERASKTFAHRDFQRQLY